MVTSPIASQAPVASKEENATRAWLADDSRKGTSRVSTLLDRWHLLSLDAPTLAAVWAYAFAHCAQVHLPWLSCAMLALATWLLYVADRLLDAVQPSHTEALQERHYFHLRHRIAFLSAAVPALAALAWFVITRMDPAPRREDFALAACAILYLLCVHLPVRTLFRLPKEPAVGIIFATACVIPTWSRHAAARPMLLPSAILFATLCWINCVAIEHWENSAQPTQGHRITFWIGNHLKGACLLLAAAAFATFLIAGNQSYATLILSVAISALLIVRLNAERGRLMPLRLRAAADAVLLTPVIFLIAPACVRTALHLHLR